MSSFEKNVVKMQLNPFLPGFIRAFVDILNVPHTQQFNPALKTEVLSTLKELVRVRDKVLLPFLPEILGPVWSTLTGTAEVYVKERVNNTVDNEDEVDSDGKTF